MRLKTLLLTTTLLASSALTAFADSPATTKASKNDQLKDFYVKAEAGVGMPTTLKTSTTTTGGTTTKGKLKFNKGFVGGVGAGYVVNEFVRTDLMLQYRDVALKAPKNAEFKGRLASHGVMLNGYLTGHNDTIFTPYVMAGAGLGQNRTKIAKKAASTTNLIWNAGLGCQAKVSDQVSVDLGYRYVNLGNLINKKDLAKVAKITKLGKLASNEVVVGLVYSF